MSSDNSEGLYQSITPEAGSQRPSWAVPLSKEALFRIQLSLSSRRSNVMVLETVCRIFIGSITRTTTSMKIQDLDPNDTDWTYQTTGVPGLLVEYRDIGEMNIFFLKLVIVELESGLCTWEGKFGVSANYQVIAEDFHTFWMPGVGQVGIEFGDVSEGERMRVLLREWLEKLKLSFSLITQQEKEESHKKKSKKKPSTILRSQSQPRIDKRQISTPCNFLHVSGITMTRTEECEKELQGTVRRFFRGAISSLSRNNTVSPGSKSRGTFKEQRKIPMTSSLGDLSGKDITKLSYPLGGDSPDQLISRCDSSQSGREKKYFSLQRKKKQSSPDESETSEFARDNQSNCSLTPNSRRRGSIHSRVITSEDYFPEQETHQRSSTINTANERSRFDQRKYSAPNIRSQVPSQWDPPEILRHHSQIPNIQSDNQNLNPLNDTDQSSTIGRFSSETHLPSYRPPPHPIHPSVTHPYHSNPTALRNEPNTPVPNNVTIPSISANHDSEIFLPPIPFSLPPDYQTYAPPHTSNNVPLRQKSYSTRRSEKTDQKRLSNSYTSFGHVVTSQVDV
ncbi:hypothetical protein LOD99_15837 [Oopsacas minuta]|uniref:Uncharacterized protein n=1 Tax=Oopsacas minuta TaxID=111878 RepID=A0AAV7KAG2_9METZ|nr:hypothetical protein LOD99_15837 [Oopsacas minuta]